MSLDSILTCNSMHFLIKLMSKMIMLIGLEIGLKIYVNGQSVNLTPSRYDYAIY
jgi:hypothetical protein